MASIGKINFSGASFTNENTVALVNLNVDVCFWRCDPSPEFVPVGSALTVKRRVEAESGSIHKTACKLGFLFNEVIPDTPNLIKAYGKRVSEILALPKVNPQGTDEDGPFRPFIGADCTSIWAAATSGSPSIGVLLLACMLADAWDAKTAISIWVELIDERKEQIQAQQKDNKMLSLQTLAAARQEFARAELASWDASVRSWIRRAGESMASKRVQFALISNNLTIPYPRGGSTYGTVILAWTRAMEVLEKLLCNIPQQACDRAVIRGISAWHLYPEMIVFQEKATKVSFQDGLFPSSGVLSLGLEYNGTPSDNYLRWSLALSHLRYYGAPVAVRSDEEMQNRITMPQLWLVTIGVIFREWNVLYGQFEVSLLWFQELGRTLSRGLAQLSRLRPRDGKDDRLSWLLRLCSAVTDIGEGEQNLVKYGWRRGANFLGKSGPHGSDEIQYTAAAPYFGLNNPHIMRALSHSTDIDSAIDYLRHISSLLQLEGDESIVAYYHGTHREYATTSPIEEHLVKSYPSVENCGWVGKRHVTWLFDIRQSDDADVASPQKHYLQERRQFIESRGEICRIIVQENDTILSTANTGSNIEINLDALFSERAEFLGLYPLGSSAYHDFGLWVRAEKHAACTQALERELRRLQLNQVESLAESISWLKNSVSADKVYRYLVTSLVESPGDISARLYARRHTKARISSQSLKRKQPHSTGSMDEKIAWTPTNKRVIDYVLQSEHGDLNASYDPSGCFSVITVASRVSPLWTLSLQILEVASHVYEALPRATVSLRILEQELLKALWLPPRMKAARDSAHDSYRAMRHPASYMDEMKRANMFACVAMFESGRFNIEPGQLAEVVALCSEDSIFVSEILLSDPSDVSRQLGIRHLVGNVGHAGMVFMVSPREPRIRPPGFDASKVAHLEYDGVEVNTFEGTSLHLSFTTWKIPLDWECTGEIDQEIFLLESVVSVQHQGAWVADIDVLGIETDRPDIISFPCDCPRNFNASSRNQSAVSIKSWDEFLDPPPCIGVLQTKRNWVARLAAVSILIQQGNGHAALILDDPSDGLLGEPLTAEFETASVDIRNKV
ncbi:conserved hypothetical protein [Verticillium alfalfae VaMs.102]|uniref:Uncharacterized protein n=1 Tax=Verticillium alfalfae (strain VaMs.102 / ATCC MYA-4576 / FGSC 10136) TaxID=526221 RepID=C9SWG2_VERA1|nr:conserved hypothetical protein [Verticillium alfalfae VaMs.102]EEY23127.1 conserved hypothetical protein [Verticillium alfalfae VaMs.102]